MRCDGSVLMGDSGILVLWDSVAVDFVIIVVIVVCFCFRRGERVSLYNPAVCPNIVRD